MYEYRQRKENERMNIGLKKENERLNIDFEQKMNV